MDRLAEYRALVERAANDTGPGGRSFGVLGDEQIAIVATALFKIARCKITIAVPNLRESRYCEPPFNMLLIDFLRRSPIGTIEVATTQSPADSVFHQSATICGGSRASFSIVPAEAWSKAGEGVDLLSVDGTSCLANATSLGYVSSGNMQSPPFYAQFRHVDTSIQNRTDRTLAELLKYR